MKANQFTMCLKKKLLAAAMGLILTFAIGAVITTAPAQTQAANTRTTLTKKMDTIISKNTKKGDTKAEKLEKLYKYVRKQVNYQFFEDDVPFAPAKNWTDAYALTTLKTNKANCYHYAAAFASLANYATGYQTRVVVGKSCGFDKTRKNTSEHAWVEIKISKKWYIFDVNMDKYGKTTKGKTVKAMSYYKKLRSSADMQKIYANYKGVKNYSVKF